MFGEKVCVHECGSVNAGTVKAASVRWMWRCSFVRRWIAAIERRSF